MQHNEHIYPSGVSAETMIPKINEKIDQQMRHFYCNNPHCHKLIFRYGAFHHEFPEEKEIRLIAKNVHDRDRIRVYNVKHPETMKDIALHITHVRCWSCGNDNKYTIAMTPNAKFLGRK